MRALSIFLIVFCCCQGCRESYDPGVRSQDQSFLVVEGNLNAGHDSTIIRLTTTFRLDDTAKLRAQENAQLAVEGTDNSIRPLIAMAGGYYVSADLNLVPGAQYRLRIKTPDGHEYLSDYVTARQSPPIDSITWERTDKGVQIYANTDDPLNATRYYRWDYDETWQINSYYYSDVIYENGTVRFRNMPDEDVSVCWKYDHSLNIPLANSTRLQQDIINRAPLTFIPEGNERISVRYSILVRQYALDREAYTFFELMKKNTEEIGTIFSPLPSEMQGNIKCITDPDRYVLGYVTASSVEKKRIFIQAGQWGFFQHCESVTVQNKPDSIRTYFAGGDYVPYFFLYPTEFRAAKAECVDCRARGGSTVRPSYW